MFLVSNIFYNNRFFLVGTEVTIIEANGSKKIQDFKVRIKLIRFLWLKILRNNTEAHRGSLKKEVLSSSIDGNTNSSPRLGVIFLTIRKKIAG